MFDGETVFLTTKILLCWTPSTGIVTSTATRKIQLDSKHKYGHRHCHEKNKKAQLVLLLARMNYDISDWVCNSS